MTIAISYTQLSMISLAQAYIAKIGGNWASMTAQAQQDEIHRANAYTALVASMLSAPPATKLGPATATAPPAAKPAGWAARPEPFFAGTRAPGTATGRADADSILAEGANARIAATSGARIAAAAAPKVTDATPETIAAPKPAKAPTTQPAVTVKK